MCPSFVYFIVSFYFIDINDGVLYFMLGVFGDILYRYNVVDGDVNYLNDIYGGRTHSACRYGCVQMHIQL